jgi:hypothetical protein
VRKQWLGTVNRQGHQDAATLAEWSGLFDACGFRVRAVVPDQWFFQKWRNRIAPRRAGAREPVVTRLVPLAFANEFIFILERGA